MTDWRRLARELAASGWLPRSLGAIYQDCLDEAEELFEALVEFAYEEEHFEQARLAAQYALEVRPLRRAA